MSTGNFVDLATNNNFLSKGAFGDVHGPIVWNDRKCAVKKTMIGESGLENMTAKFVKIKDISTSLEHRNLIRIYDVYFNPPVFGMLMEYAAGGSLSSCLMKICNSGFTGDQRLSIVSDWIKQIAEGMLYLHERNLVHRDLKPGNILLMESFDTDNPCKEVLLKISDFDEIGQHESTMTMSLKGTPAYMAPEVLATERFSKASDVWSFGVVVQEMLTGEISHKGLTQRVLMRMAMDGQLHLPILESLPKGYKQLVSACLSKETGSRPSFQDIVTWCGSTDLTMELLIKNYESDPVWLKTFRTKAGKEICGVTILDNELFILSALSSEIEVYNSVELSFSRLLKLKGLTQPWNMGSSSQNKSLYIMDVSGKPKKVMRVDPNGQVLCVWPIGDDYCGLSVTDEANVILTFHHKNKIEEYSPDGILIRNVELPDTFYPLHAVKLTNDRFLVSCGRSDLHQVCLVDALGKVEKSFGEHRGSTEELMNIPTYLAVDRNGFVFVVDQMNNRVLLLDSNLTFVREILSKNKHRLRRPSVILLDEPNSRLLVVDYVLATANGLGEGGQILIFYF